MSAFLSMSCLTYSFIIINRRSPSISSNAVTGMQVLGRDGTELSCLMGRFRIGFGHEPILKIWRKRLPLRLMKSGTRVLLDIDIHSESSDLDEEVLRNARFYSKKCFDKEGLRMSCCRRDDNLGLWRSCRRKRVTLRAMEGTTHTFGDSEISSTPWLTCNEPEESHNIIHSVIDIALLDQRPCK
jgi:hypothetical protein